MAETKEVEGIGEEYDLTAEIVNLTSAYSTIIEIDLQMLDKFDQTKIVKIKDRIIQSLDYFCSFLPKHKTRKDETQK